MRYVFKSVLVAVAVLALSGVTAVAASASEHGEWLLTGVPVKESTPVTDTATEFNLHRQRSGGGEEIVKCTLSGKGTVNANGAGTITSFNLTTCTGVTPVLGTCEPGTTSASALNLPWTTQVFREGLVPLFNAEAGVDVTWQCTVQIFTEHRLYKVTCGAGHLESALKNESGYVQESWKLLGSEVLRCQVHEGSEEYPTNGGFLVGTTHLKAENAQKELSAR